MLDEGMLLSDHLAEALAALNRAREACRQETVNHRATVMQELTNAELAIARVIGFVVGPPS